jgi:anti-anti-sigma factor
MIRLPRQTEGQKFEVNHIHGITVVNVAGELSRYNMRFLEEVFSSFIDRGQLNVILNFEKLSHMDYQLVRRLADHIVCFQCEGGDIKIANASVYIQQILKVMGLEDEEVYPTVEDAIMGFFVHQPDGELQ